MRMIEMMTKEMEIFIMSGLEIELFVSYFEWYMIGMFLYICLKGLKAGFFEASMVILHKWEIIFYPFFVVAEIGRYVGIVLINVIKFIVDRFF